jgi:hypothetical protein
MGVPAVLGLVCVLVELRLSLRLSRNWDLYSPNNDLLLNV